MKNLLSSYTNSRDNNFNLIRFIAASLVLFSHSFALSLGGSEFEPLKTTIGMTWGMIAVDVFFITSGFLITNSFLTRNKLLSYAWARLLRIYPALIVATVFCVLVLGVWFTKHTIYEYIMDTQTHKYFVKNSTLFFGTSYSLPGVFIETPFKSTVNGSIWTLPYELKMYVILAVILCFVTYMSKWIKFLTIKNALLVIGVFSVGLHLFNHFHTIFSANFVRFFSMFFIGSAFFTWSDKVVLSSKFAIFGLPLLIIVSINKDIFFVIYNLLLPFLVFYLAYIPSGKIRKFNRIGDYSYGIYIYAFPVQQSIAATIPNVSVSTMIILSFIVTLFLAILSWHLIEKRFLKMKDGYIHIEKFIQKLSLTRRYIQTK